MKDNVNALLNAVAILPEQYSSVAYPLITESTIAPLRMSRSGGLMVEIAKNYSVPDVTTGTGTLPPATNAVLPDMASPPLQWSQHFAPAVGTGFTGSQSALSGYTLIVTGICASLTAVNAQAAPVTFSLISGSTTIWQQRAVALAGTSVHINLAGLNIASTYSTALTIGATAPAAGNYVTIGAYGWLAY